MSQSRILRKSPRLLTDQSDLNRKKLKISPVSRGNGEVSKPNTFSFFIGEPVPEDEAKRRWPWRYQNLEDEKKNGQRGGRRQNSSEDDEDDILVLNVKSHYLQAEVDKIVFNIGDCVYVKGKEGEENYIGQILEFFKTTEDEDYFRVQWFFKAKDTVIQFEADSHDKKRIFYSDTMNDNVLDSIVSKLRIIQLEPNANLKSKRCDYYYDMKYSVDYSTFQTLGNSISTSSSSVEMKQSCPDTKDPKQELALLDLYAGCGGMSTGLCLGAKTSGIDLVTKWAVEINNSASESLKLNHPETQIRNEAAEDFLDLLKEWDRLCKKYTDTKGKAKLSTRTPKTSRYLRSKSEGKKSSKEFEVESLLDICFGDPNKIGKRGLNFKVRWLGYGPSEDTWEPAESLGKCQEKIQEFVIKGYDAKILPRPGDVDVICGGPPCQGISGYNRHRNLDNPLDDEKNVQIIVFMDIVTFLKPKYVLMENVVDILRFAKGCLARYALSRLVHNKYQARLGIMAAASYGLPQFRLRVFLWGAHPQEELPQFPLPTHDVILRYGAPTEFERNIVAYDEGHSVDLGKALVLSDAISDLPPVSDDEVRDEMSYEKPPETDLQSYFRATKCEMIGSASYSAVQMQEHKLYDHMPLQLSGDDYIRVTKIPRRKGANFRDLPGVVVGNDNIARRDPTTEIILPSGKQLIPDYALNLTEGKSKRPFSRIWWDECAATVICFPNPHTQTILHPEQDRVLTVRECARLQGFQDYYRFCGKVTDRYSQVGNAVAGPVGRALGYSLGLAMSKLNDAKHLTTLPPNFSHSTTLQLAETTVPPNFTHDTTHQLAETTVPPNVSNDTTHQVAESPLPTLP